MIVYFAFVPEYETPDELRHIETAYSLSNKIYGEDKDGNVYMRQNDYRNLYSNDKSNVFHKTFSREYYNNYYYSLIHDSGIAYNDPQIGIDLEFDKNKLVLSDKDKAQPMLSNINSPFDF